MPTVSFTLNGSPVTAEHEEGTHLLELLREGFGIRTLKDGCAPEGFCGSCTVLIDGSPMPACSKSADQVAGHEVVTLDGIPEEERRTLAEAFVSHGAVQCGFCTPGMLISATALLAENPSPTEEEIRIGLSGNLCRCTGYDGIVKAVLSVTGDM